jgi:hypothetical protein
LRYGISRSFFKQNFPEYYKFFSNAVAAHIDIPDCDSGFFK